MIQFINIIMLNNLFLKNINKTNPLISIKKLKLDILAISQQKNPSYISKS